jgi:hypothetical protein
MTARDRVVIDLAERSEVGAVRQRHDRLGHPIGRVVVLAQHRVHVLAALRRQERRPLIRPQRRCACRGVR